MTVKDNPIIITGTAGTGTRVFTDILEIAGVNMGLRQNPQKDNKDFIQIIKNGIPLADPGNIHAENFLSQAQTPDFAWELLNQLTIEKAEQQVKNFKKAITDDLSEQDVFWGWKESQSMFVLPFLKKEFPEMKVIHVIRDGRDIAFSTQQRAKYQVSYNQILSGETNIMPEDSNWPILVSRVWQIVNLGVVNWANKNLKSNQYFRVKLEDLKYNFNHTVENLYAFLSIQNYKLDHIIKDLQFDPDKLRLEKYKNQDSDLVKDIENEIRDGLKIFGYHHDPHA